MEKQIKSLVSTSNLEKALKKVVKSENFTELEDIVSKLKKSSQENQEVMTKKYKQINEDMKNKHD